MIKLYAWEIPFQRTVMNIRNEETSSLRRASNFKAVNDGLFLSASPLMLLCTFLPYVALGNTLTAAAVFPTIAFYSIVRLSVTNFVPRAIEAMSEARYVPLLCIAVMQACPDSCALRSPVSSRLPSLPAAPHSILFRTPLLFRTRKRSRRISLQRLQAFLALDEIDVAVLHANRDRPSGPGQVAIRLNNASFRWPLVRRDGPRAASPAPAAAVATMTAPSGSKDDAEDVSVTKSGKIGKAMERYVHTRMRTGPPASARWIHASGRIIRKRGVGF